MIIPILPTNDPGRFIASSSQARESEEGHRECLVDAKHKQRCQSKASDWLEAEDEMYESCNS